MKTYAVVDLTGGEPTSVLVPRHGSFDGVLPRMLDKVSKFQVIQVIVQPIVVFMMHVFSPAKLATKMLLHNVPMLSGIVLLTNSNPPITVLHKPAFCNLAFRRYGVRKGSAAERTVHTSALVEMTASYLIVLVAVKTRNNIVKTSILSRNFLNNFMSGHVIMIPQRSML